MSDIKSVEANNDCKLYQHQMLLSEDRFELQSIKDDQKADQDLIEKMIFIQNQIIVENQMNQLCFDI